MNEDDKDDNEDKDDLMGSDRMKGQVCILMGNDNSQEWGIKLNGE